MNKVMSQEKFIEKAKLVYGNRYGYSKVEYRGCNNEVIVIDLYTGEEKSIKPSKFLNNKRKYNYDWRRYYNYDKKTKEERAEIFIKKSKEKFGDRFDYSKVEYVDSKTPVTLICKEHGEFRVNMYCHLKTLDGGCPFCKTKHGHGGGGGGSLSTDYIIKRCQKIYGDKYDYSKVEYKGGNSKNEVVEIVCPIHGSFFKKYERITKRDCGCPKCATINSKSTFNVNYLKNEFIEKSKNKFGDRFDYSEVEYKNYQTPITLVCKEHGIRFSVRPDNHLSTRFGGCNGCYERYIESTRSSKPKLTEEEKKERRREHTEKHFIEKAMKKFGNRFDYSKVKYVDCKTPVDIIDKESDNKIFSIKPCNFLNLKKGKSRRMSFTTEKFIERARKIHGDKYDYSKVEYKHNKKNVCIICPIHGEFWQTPHNHLITRKRGNGCGCPKCSHTVSKLEENVINRLTEENIKFKKEYINKEIFGNMRADFFIKAYNVIVECQGSQHFEENNNLHNFYGGSLSGQIERDYNFNNCCKKANITLFYYFNKNNVKDIDYLNDKKFNGIYTEKNTFTNVDNLISHIKMSSH